MRISITGRHMEMTDALKSHIEGRLERIRGHFDRVIDADVVLDVEKHRHIAEINIHANGVHLHGKESSTDMYASIDAVVDKLDKQVRRYKDRKTRSQSRRGKGAMEYEHHIIEMEQPVAVPEDEQEGDVVANGGHRVVKRETLRMKPMEVAEAAEHLEMDSEPFLVFSNAQTQKVNVLYSRDDGTLGLIEPQF